MSLRNKLLLVFAGAGVLPLAAVCVLGYATGGRAVEGLLRARAGDRAERIAHRIERKLDEQQGRLSELAQGRSLGDFVRAAGEAAPPQPLPETARAHLAAFFDDNHTHFESVVCFDAGGRPIFRLAAAGDGAAFQTESIVAGHVRPDERARAEAGAWRTLAAEPLAYGPSLLITATIPAAGQQGPTGGALVAEVRLTDLIRIADGGEAAPVAGAARAQETVVALVKGSDVIAYHTIHALRHVPVARAMPGFEPAARRMFESVAGEVEYQTAAGDRWLASFRQTQNPTLAVAVAEDYTAAAAGVRRALRWGLLLSALAAAAGLASVWALAGRAERDAKAVAAGDFNQRVETGGMGAETRELAESFNQMSDRLRAHITTTSETRQFESFMRLSAMLSHDLKNAIAGLSLLVNNMEKHIHREEFRADAVNSLRQATDKLRRLVARLSEPVKSLSGEYRREARPTDLVAVVRRVLAANVEPHASLYEVEAKLPDRLVATVEPDRIENVFENLVINAVEAMGAAGGRLTVEAGELGDGLVYFAVSDTGVGMDETFLRTRLYRPFSTTKTKGIGLGLYTCREVVEAHGGRLEVESRLGVGTRFRVVLPSRLIISADRRAPAQKGARDPETGEPGA